MIKKFRGLLKSSLSKSSYKEFTGFIAEYKQTKDCKKFVDNVLTIPLQKKVYDEIFLSNLIIKCHKSGFYPGISVGGVRILINKNKTRTLQTNFKN